MTWKVPKLWLNETCWIIGGGPSITTQFKIPRRIVQQVRDNEKPISTYSPYMSLLHDKHVIGINGAFKLGDWVDFCFFGDRTWFFPNAPELAKYKGILVGCDEFLKVPGWQQQGIRYLEKDVRPFGISDNPETVCWNMNSGSSAISFAHHLGCNRIILLGFDMALSPAGVGHWHNLYDNKTNMPFQKHLRGFDSIAADAQKLGITIINASPTSRIECFPKMNVWEIENV